MSALKGNLLVGQSGGPTAVINASLYGVIKAAAQRDEIAGVYGCRHGAVGLLTEDLVDLRRESPETLEGLLHTPSAALGASRQKLSDAEYERILQVLRAHHVRYLCYIGGNDSADTCHRVHTLSRQAGYEVRAIGVPKTVDNDLALTDHSPGYGSVARFNAIATMDAGLDTEAIGIVDNVKVIETMGRNAGWITASTAFARQGPDQAPHLIYLPERPFDPERFLRDVRATFDRLGYCLVTVCEGLRNEKGEELVASARAVDTDSFGHRQLGGVCSVLCDLIATNLGIKARWDKPGTIQRMSSVCASATDIAEARIVGEAAVAAAVGGESDRMVILVRQCDDPYRCTTGLAPLEEVANAEKPVPPEFINAEGNWVTQAYLDYARPLLGGPLPSYVRLEGHRVPKRLG